ncbi:MAG TPA: hypothetical protein DCW90_17645, partial [Lachnospiraceae bacterium]|nr:hypothetical protein [Lachnospiraceae bacterium]
MVNVLWIGENPQTTTSSSLVGWPVCMRLALMDYDVSYLALDVFSSPYEKDKVKVIPTIVQDMNTPIGLGSVQNMFNIVYKRVTPDVVIVCLDNVKTKEILYQLKQIKFNNIIVWKFSEEQLQVENEHIQIAEFSDLGGEQQLSVSEPVLYSEDIDKVIEKWCELLEPFQNSKSTQVSEKYGINFKGNVWGNGSMSLTSRLLASALESIGVDVSLENTVLKRPEQCTFIKDEQEKIEFEKMERKKIDSNQYVHIRYSGPQPSETHLMEGHFDYTIGRKNIAYWSIDYSSLEGPGCPSADLLNNIPDQVWVPSTHSKYALIESGVIEEKIRIVPNGYLEDVFMPMQTHNTAKRKFTFLHVSNFKFYKRKGVDVLLESYIKAFDKDDEVELMIHSQNEANMEEILGFISKFQSNYKHHPEIVIKNYPLTHKELSVLYNES